ncbi:MAG: TIGR03842 family LLM class F420-dependent oxidoreductase [Actinomycetota bacterium]|jgi:probable F420-dependent oxidoreductase|uniref:Luciferase-like domain-containing protein n=1 Tax=marine metagenome TaxID=408172 RepID=A0A381Y6K0_9ZZZZ|nr:TIGR03842 family LLM class F420-dependent oxidoreductase [Acidimicrobiaceae bacterium]MEC9202406.1 TIGR03842 family LLM class F420-dependent oxidoreductase [Actinomycetota bacterium]MED5583535.1 TIGR03842 family LLM class F420-dependent oxidoreductase [Actinomycetota bacterium]MEE3115497.1 TIGR03842 family LLM class F420-dependent oxidoreductase [Actinomycetota bacterium]|tara:strand:+ start:1680 stop:2684 length:1005 start_codon:yes stop_codon:yes gene_type:complete
MDFGVVLQTDPPARRVVDFARKAEALGFTHAYTFDSHVLWQEPYVIHSAMLAATSTLTVGPMVTNPGTRDWTVTASVFATLNEMYGERTVCGIGRGDSAMRVIGYPSCNLATLEEAMDVIKGLAEGGEVDYNGTRQTFPWCDGGSLPMWMAAYGPKALALCGRKADGFILQLADPQIAAWTIGAVRRAAEEAGRDPDSITICVVAPAYVGDDIAHQRDQVRWFGGMVGNHVADLVGRYGTDGTAVPQALTDYIEGRKGYDYSEHGRAGAEHTEFVPDEIIDRFCILGDEAAHIARLEELRDLGVDQFAIYLMHDQQDETLDAYGRHVMPALSGN